MAELLPDDVGTPDGNVAEIAEYAVGVLPRLVVVALLAEISAEDVGAPEEVNPKDVILFHTAEVTGDETGTPEEEGTIVSIIVISTVAVTHALLFV